MSDSPYKKMRHSFVVGFSFISKPEGLEEVGPDNQPNPEMMQLAINLGTSPPMLSFIFDTPDEEPPTIAQIYACVREGYTATSGNPVLNEAYGLFLDALKAINSSPLPFGKGNKPQTAIPEELLSIMPPDVRKSFDRLVNSLESVMSSRACGNVFSMNDKIACLKMQPMTAFEVGERE